jgi:glycosyltransferase involved in cell wall biosynthesis
VRVAINALTASVTSGPTFFDNILPELDRLGPSHEFRVFASERQTRLLESLTRRFEAHPVRGLARGAAGRLLWEQTVLPLSLRRWGAEILYASGNLVSLGAGCRTVVTVTNANPFSFLPRTGGAGERLKLALLRAAGGLAARRADRVVFLTETSRALIGPRLGLRPEKTAVMPYGYTPFSGAAGASAPWGDYILTVGVLFDYKNLDTLMRGFDRLAAQHGYGGSLVIVGPTGSASCLARLRALRDVLPHGGRIVFAGALRPEELAAAYRNARVFAFPSLEETFGLPLLEAMGCGVPVAASDGTLSKGSPPAFTPAPEICGDAAEYFDPRDAGAVCDVLRRLVFDDERRQRMALRGRERARQFTWEDSARRLLAVFESLSR